MDGRGLVGLVPNSSKWRLHVYGVLVSRNFVHASISRESV